MSALVWPHWPTFEEDEIEAVQRVLRSGRVNAWTGHEVKNFESEFAEWIGVKHAVALANGTLALEAALKAMSIGPGDEVIVPARTFIATASAVVACGAKPIIADVDLNTHNMTAETILPHIGEKSKAVIVVHLNGLACEMDEIMQLARRHGLFVIEDCAQAHGAKYRGRTVGSIGDIGAFSFCQDKIMTTGGEGGMITTDSEEWMQKIWQYKDHGKAFSILTEPHLGTGFRWCHETFGTNWRMTEMQAAIGRCQLKKLNDWLALRRRNAAVLIKNLSTVQSLNLPCIANHLEHAYYKFPCMLRSDTLFKRNEMIRHLQSKGVPAFVGVCPEIYLENAFKEKGWGLSERCSNAKLIGEKVLQFLVHPTLSAEHMQTMATVIKSAFECEIA